MSTKAPAVAHTVTTYQPGYPPKEDLDMKSFDQDCREFLKLTAKAAEAKKAADELKPRLMASAERFGLVPDGAPKSTRITTRKFVATRTTGLTTEILDAVVLELSIQLAKHKLSALFALLFKPRTEYSLIEGAEAAMEQAKLPKKHAEALRNMFARSFKHNTTAPKLTVVTAQEFMNAAAKAAKKAAKAAEKEAA